MTFTLQLQAPSFKACGYVSALITTTIGHPADVACPVGHDLMGGDVWHSTYSILLWQQCVVFTVPS
jgi:hypothetical protein